MSTPDHDLELAVGFLFTEGSLTEPEEVESIRACAAGNVARVDLRPGIAEDLTRLEWHSHTSSSCGVCGTLGAAQAVFDRSDSETRTPLSVM
jgi:FdhD protein